MFKVLGDGDICAGFVIDLDAYVCWNDGFVSFNVGFDGNGVIFVESLVFTDRKKLWVGFDSVYVVFCYITRGSVRDDGVEDIHFIFTFTQ